MPICNDSAEMGAGASTSGAWNLHLLECAFRKRQTRRTSANDPAD
jgi:hypothetical protein